jgi:hypothetical protein
LDQVVKLGLKVNCAVKFIVAELAMDRVPDLVCGSFGTADDGTHILGHRVVQPGNDALINHDPFLVAAVVSGGSIGEVGPEAKFADESIKETLPLGIVGLGQTEFDGDMSMNVHRL